MDYKYDVLEEPAVRRRATLCFCSAKTHSGGVLADFGETP
jgi:hypothetical protein